MKTYSKYAAVITMVMVVTSISFFVKCNRPQLWADVVCIVSPDHKAEHHKLALMKEYAAIYKQELQSIKARKYPIDDYKENTAVNPIGQPTISDMAEVDPTQILAGQLATAALHVKYNNLISEKGYDWSEMDRLLCEADKAKIPDTLCLAAKK